METKDLELPASWYLEHEPKTLAYQLTRKGLPRLADLISELFWKLEVQEKEHQERIDDLEDEVATECHKAELVYEDRDKLQEQLDEALAEIETLKRENLRLENEIMEMEQS